MKKIQFQWMIYWEHLIEWMRYLQSNWNLNIHSIIFIFFFTQKLYTFIKYIYIINLYTYIPTIVCLLKLNCPKNFQHNSSSETAHTGTHTCDNNTHTWIHAHATLDAVSFAATSSTQNCERHALRLMSL